MVEGIRGQPGQFDVSLKTNGTATQFRVGAVVQTTGWKPYDAFRLAHLGYGRSADVITNVQMEELLASGKLHRPSDGKPARRIAFIQCAGSRDESHLPYCSAVCCRVTLKQALWARELDGQVQAYVFYKDIRAPGQYEDFYRRVQEDPLIFFTKGDVRSVEPTADRHLLVDVENTLIDKHIQVEADLVVLATGMVPVAADGEAIRRLRDAKAVFEKGESVAQLGGGNGNDRETPAARRDGDFAPRLPPRAGLAGAQAPVPRFPLHLFPLRDATDGDLCGWVRAGAERFRGLPARRGGRRDEGHPVRGAYRPRRRRPPALGRPVLPGYPTPALHAVQALHRGVPVRNFGRGPQGHADAERHAMPPLRHMHGRLPRADHLRLRTIPWRSSPR